MSMASEDKGKQMGLLIYHVLLWPGMHVKYQTRKGKRGQPAKLFVNKSSTIEHVKHTSPVAGHWSAIFWGDFVLLPLIAFSLSPEA